MLMEMIKKRKNISWKMYNTFCLLLLKYVNKKKIAKPFIGSFLNALLTFNKRVLADAVSKKKTNDINMR